MLLTTALANGEALSVVYELIFADGLYSGVRRGNLKSVLF